MPRKTRELSVTMGKIGQGHLLTHMAALWGDGQEREEEGSGPSAPTGNLSSLGGTGQVWALLEALAWPRSRGARAPLQRILLQALPRRG